MLADAETSMDHCAWLKPLFLTFGLFSEAGRTQA